MISLLNCKITEAICFVFFWNRFIFEYIFKLPVAAKFWTKKCLMRAVNWISFVLQYRYFHTHFTTHQTGAKSAVNKNLQLFLQKPKKMSRNILDLNDDCLSCILKYLPVDSHKNFVKVCQRFKDVWLDNKKLIYKTLELGKTTVEGFERELLLLRQISGYVKHLILNFNRHFVWNEVWLQEVINILKTMIGLEYATIWIREKEVEESFELFLRTLQRLPNIKGVAAYEDGKWKVI